MLRLDPEGVGHLARQLGFRRRATDIAADAPLPTESAPQRASPTSEVLEAPEVLDVPEVPEVPEGPAHIWRVTEEIQRDLPPPDPLPPLKPLPVEGGDVLKQPRTPELTPWRALWPRLYDLIADTVAGRSIDVPRLVGDVARGRPLLRLPRRTHRRWPERLTLWVHRHLDLVPLWDDQDAVRTGLARWCPQIEERFHPGDFHPRPGETALLLGDLTALGRAARHLARQAEERGARLAALTARPAAVRGWQVAPWQTPAAGQGTPEERAERLLTLVAAVPWAQPGLLRALRMTLPAGQADVTTELDVWRHPAVIARAPDGLVVDPVVARGLRRQLPQPPGAPLGPRAPSPAATSQTVQNPGVPLGPRAPSPAATSQAGTSDGPPSHARQAPGGVPEAQAPARTSASQAGEGARGPSGHQVGEDAARAVRPSARTASALIADWHGQMPASLRHLDALVWAGEDAPFDPAVAQDYFKHIKAHLLGGRAPELGHFARLASDQIVTALDHRPHLKELVSLLWVAGHTGAEVAVPEGIDLSVASRVRPGAATDLHLLHAEGALRLATAPRGVRLARLRSTQDVAWVRRAEGLRQQPLGAAIELGDGARIEIETDLSRVVVEQVERPAWAVAFGVQRGWVWAEAELDGQTRRLWAGATGWQGADGYGADGVGVFHVADLAGQPLQCRLIPAGEFLMGSPTDDQEAHGDERPQHPVRLTLPFWLAEVPVTQAVWQAVMGDNPSGLKGADRPVETVSWEDAQRFIAKLPGAGWRLPTEAQWEYACRAGTTTPRYGELDAVAWWSGNSGRQTHPVGQKAANPWGLHDMLGNVWEWCADWSGSYGNTLDTDPSGPQGGSFRVARVARGGSWADTARRVRAACRDADAPSGHSVLLGFRLARGPALQARSAVPLSGGVLRAEPGLPSRSDGPSGQARSAGGGAERGPARPEGHPPEAVRPEPVRPEPLRPVEPGSGEVPSQEPQPEPKRSWFSRIFGKRKPPDETP